MFFKGITLLLSLALSQIASADLLAAPNTKWETRIQPLNPSDSSASVQRGNGLFLTPGYDELIAVAADGRVSSIDPETGSSNWVYNPTAKDGSAIVSKSGMTFSDSFMVYAVNYEGAETTRVIALDMSGNLLHESEELDGFHAGNPVVSSDGNYIYMTHNSDGNTVGHFTMLKPDGSGGMEKVFDTRSCSDGPFSPIGIFHGPEEGFYDTIEAGSQAGLWDATEDEVVGIGNTNDMLMWQLAPVAPRTSVPNGRIFGFQVPAFAEPSSDLSYFILGVDASRGFRTDIAPLLSNKGRSAYFPSSRSQYYNFIGKEFLNRAKFNRGPNFKPFFDKNPQWPGQPVFSRPAIVDGPNDDGTIFGGTAGFQFFRSYHAFDQEMVVGDAGFTVLNETIIKDTATFIYSAPVVDPMQRAVYYAEINGDLHQVDYNTIDSKWQTSIEGGVQGEMALNADGSVLYISSITGSIKALNVGSSTAAPTSSPTTPVPTGETAPPTTSPPTAGSPGPTQSRAPTLAPTMTPKPSVSAAPSGAPTTSAPTMSPTTAEPTKAPTKSPTKTPTSEAPTEESSADEDDDEDDDVATEAPSSAPFAKSVLVGFVAAILSSYFL